MFCLSFGIRDKKPKQSWVQGNNGPTARAAAKTFHPSMTLILRVV
jgi:hypothetical protein